MSNTPIIVTDTLSAPVATNQPDSLPANFSLVAQNRDKVTVSFRKNDRQFIESIKAYTDLSLFLKKMSEQGFIADDTSLPVFHQEPAKTMTSIKYKYTAATKKKISEHPVFSEPKITIHEYKRTQNNVMVGDSPYDYANFGRYKVNFSIKAHLNVGSTYKRLKPEDRKFIIDTLNGLWASNNAYYWSSTQKTAAQIAALNLARRNILEKYEIFLVNLGTGTNVFFPQVIRQELNSILQPYNARNMNPSIDIRPSISRDNGSNNYYSNIYIRGENITTKPQLNGDNIDAFLYRNYIAKSGVDSSVISRLNSLNRTVSTFEQAQASTGGLVNNLNAIGNIWTQNIHADNIVLDSKPATDSCLLIPLANLSSHLIGNNVYSLLLAYKNPGLNGSKPFVDLTRFDFQGTIDFCLGADTMRNPSRFFEAHKRLQDKLKEYTDANRF